MKNSTLYALVAGLVLGGMLLPGTALAEKRTPFTDTETVTGLVNAGTWITDGKSLFVTGLTLSGLEKASDPRLAGTSTVWVDRITDLATQAVLMWGRFRIENDGGAWDGYWCADSSVGSSLATIVGSGDYEGLVARMTWLGGSDWEGCIVENGPGPVPMKDGSWERIENFDWIVGDVVVPFTMQPTGDKAVVGKISLVNGGGVQTHTGKSTDVAEVGLVTFPTKPTTAAWSCFGTVKAANGDLLNYVAMGENDLAAGVNSGTVHFTGGTGRFDAATGSLGVPSGIGTIRY